MRVRAVKSLLLAFSALSVLPPLAEAHDWDVNSPVVADSLLRYLDGYEAAPGHQDIIGVEQELSVRNGYGIQKLANLVAQTLRTNLGSQPVAVVAKGEDHYEIRCGEGRYPWRIVPEDAIQSPRNWLGAESASFPLHGSELNLLRAVTEALAKQRNSIVVDPANQGGGTDIHYGFAEPRALDEAVASAAGDRRHHSREVRQLLDRIAVTIGVYASVEPEAVSLWPPQPLRGDLGYCSVTLADPIRRKRGLLKDIATHLFPSKPLDPWGYAIIRDKRRPHGGQWSGTLTVRLRPDLGTFEMGLFDATLDWPKLEERIDFVTKLMRAVQTKDPALVDLIRKRRLSLRNLAPALNMRIAHRVASAGAPARLPADRRAP